MSNKIFTYGIILMIMFFGSCNSTEPEENINDDIWNWGLRVELSKETELQIREDYLKNHVQIEFPQATIEDVWVERYYGTYYSWNDTIYNSTGDYNDIIRLDDDYSVAVMMASNYDECDDVEEDFYLKKFRAFFRHIYGNGSRITIWHKGIFYKLKELITPLEIPVDPWGISNYHHGLSGELEKQVQQYMYDVGIMSIKIAPPNYGCFTNYGIYYGNYIVIYLPTEGGTRPWEYIIDGIIFAFSAGGGDPIIVICTKEWQHYGLQYAYEQKLLSYEDLVNIAYYHTFGNVQYINGGKK